MISPVEIKAFRVHAMVRRRHSGTYTLAICLRPEFPIRKPTEWFKPFIRGPALYSRLFIRSDQLHELIFSALGRLTAVAAAE